MSFGDILGQIMQQGLGGQTQTRGRLQAAANNMDQGGGLQSIFGQLQDALGGTGGAGGAMGGFADKARDFLRVAPHVSIFPGITIMLTVLGLNLLGDGLRDVLDPRTGPG